MVKLISEISDLCDFNPGMVVGVIWTGLSILDTANLLAFSHMAVFRVYTLIALEASGK